MAATMARPITGRLLRSHSQPQSTGRFQGKYPPAVNSPGFFCSKDVEERWGQPLRSEMLFHFSLQGKGRLWLPDGPLREVSKSSNIRKPICVQAEGMWLQHGCPGGTLPLSQLIGRDMELSISPPVCSSQFGVPHCKALPLS